MEGGPYLLVNIKIQMRLYEQVDPIVNVECKIHFRCYLAASHSTDYGHPMKPFFIEIQNFWSWADNLNWADKLGRQIGQINLGYF